ncbi:hypothetical protein KC330_g3147 [Hortaea werneckii]|nr:hypothetical protein KC330_g3147 [Hortaea werneckii]
MDNLTPPPSQEMASSGPAFGPPPAIELDVQQQEAYDDAVARRNLFITGAAGSGKSTIIRMFISALQDQGKRVRICAPTGKAAEQIGGTTYHSFLKLSQGTNNNSIRQLEWKARASWLRPQLKDTDLLFIDEISMVQNEDLQRIDRMLRAGRSSNEPFGGVQGMTLESVLVDVSRCFEPGQVYVALSRASKLDGLKVVGLTNGYAFPSGNPDVHEFLWEKFPELRPELDNGDEASEAE